LVLKDAEKSVFGQNDQAKLSIFEIFELNDETKSDNKQAGAWAGRAALLRRPTGHGKFITQQVHCF